jgi:predicted TIM-barrel fold metal-dependent hydrolase
MNGEVQEEAPLEPERPIIDPHLHLWEILSDPLGLRSAQRFLFHDALAMIERSGNNVTHSVFVECHAMHRCDGPAEMRPVGETEFANGQAAISASGNYGPARLAHRIVGTANLLLGERVAPVLEAHITAAGERFRGIRAGTAWSEAGMFGMPGDPAGKGVLTRPEFREGAKVLARMGLSLDVWCFHTQLAELIELASALPELTIVLDHVGTPESQGRWAGRGAEARAEWATLIAELALRPNVAVKLGGLGMDLGQGISGQSLALPSAVLAERWRPYLETCIEAFGPARAMFESNFPPDNQTGTYGATWNAFKIIAQGCSEGEKDDLFRRTAARTYKIDLDA